MLSEVKNNPETEMFLFTSYDYFEDQGFYKRKEHFNLKNIRTNSKLNYYKDLLQNGNLEVSASTKILRKSFLLKNNLFFKEGIVTEDSEWIIRVLRVLNYVKIIDEPLYLCRGRRNGSISNTLKVKNQIDTLNFIESSLRFCSCNFLNTNNLELCFCSYLWFSSLAIASRYNHLQKKEIKQYFKKTKNVCKYSNSKKTKLAYIVYKIFGYHITMKILGIYLLTKKKNVGRVKVEL